MNKSILKHLVVVYLTNVHLYQMSLAIKVRENAIIQPSNTTIARPHLPE